MTLFQEKVYSVVQKIPKGKVSTYKKIAKAINQPKAYRAVGNTLHKNTLKNIPCHRVIRSNLQIGGYRKGSKEKEKKLKKEGVVITNGHVGKQFIWP